MVERLVGRGCLLLAVESCALHGDWIGSSRSVGVCEWASAVSGAACVASMERVEYGYRILTVRGHWTGGSVGFAGGEGSSSYMYHYPAAVR